MTPYLVNYGDGYANLQSKVFFIWFGCCFICISFVYFFIYETKGLSLEEVDELYSEVKGISAARKSQVECKVLLSAGVQQPVISFC